MPIYHTGSKQGFGEIASLKWSLCSGLLSMGSKECQQLSLHVLKELFLFTLETKIDASWEGANPLEVIRYKL